MHVQKYIIVKLSDSLSPDRVKVKWISAGPGKGMEYF